LLVPKVVSEFRNEPCPEAQREIRPALVSLLEATASAAWKDAESLVETLPAPALAALDRAVSDFRVIEAIEAVLASAAADDDLKEKAISLLRLLLPLIPKSKEWIKTLVELVLQIIELLQKDK
jgi:hypothetical protein